jgi:hypothetical protein
MGGVHSGVVQIVRFRVIDRRPKVCVVHNRHALVKMFCREVISMQSRAKIWWEGRTYGNIPPQDPWLGRVPPSLLSGHSLSSPWNCPDQGTRPGRRRSWRHAYDLWRKARPRARPGLRDRPSRGTEGIDGTMARCLHMYRSCYAVWRLVIVRVSTWWTSTGNCPCGGGLICLTATGFAWVKLSHADARFRSRGWKQVAET